MSCETGTCPPTQETAQQGHENKAHDPLDPTTFKCPEPLSCPTVTIEFCDRCRWHVPLLLHRATWVQTELFLTFPPPKIGCISLLPRNTEETAGRFRVWLSKDAKSGPILLWDRKVEGGFPELKVLKQRLRDKISPEQSLGHSDKKSQAGH
ncbi:Rdx family-domain-containing protein [Coprinopsis sp. MPI-PUGE-AT-0042]|nr:Rdx family-domain-containing protein [Coprinopsis sp. MPI-PUGE-AT-0042]